MSLRQRPHCQRPREKLLYAGPASLSDAELIAIFLRTGIPGKDALELAHELLEQFKGLRPLLEAQPQRLSRVRGLGVTKSAQLLAALELGRRYLRSDLQRGDVMESPTATRDYLRMSLRGYEHEVFACLFLDNRHRIISFDKMFNGTINTASVHPREVVKRALQHNAAAVIFSHNHPSGTAEPSRSDRLLTRRLKEALQLVDIRVLDHLVIGDTEVSSFAEMGLL